MSKLKLSDIHAMKEDELRSVLIEAVKSAEDNAEIIRKLQVQVSAVEGKCKELSLEKVSIAAKRDQHQMKLDVYMQITDELITKILKPRGCSCD